jgi:uncharacterized protein YigE (DUF2233 family)
MYKNAGFDVFMLRCDTTLGKQSSIQDNAALDTEDVYFRTIASGAPIFCITAGIVDSACLPLGLCVANGQQMHAINAGNGNGNFYLKPNGVLAIEANGNAHIVSQEDYPGLQPKEAIQSGPMLLIKGKINDAFNNRSKNKNMRCGVGITSNKTGQWLVFIKSNTPVTFYEMAELFKDRFHCENALNLESGGLCSMHLPTVNKNYSPNIKVCRYLLIQL